jgi:hypothetical protein
LSNWKPKKLVTNVVGSLASSNALLSLLPPQPSQFQLLTLLPAAP